MIFQHANTSQFKCSLKPASIPLNLIAIQSSNNTGWPLLFVSACIGNGKLIPLQIMYVKYCNLSYMLALLIHELSDFLCFCQALRMSCLVTTESLNPRN